MHSIHFTSCNDEINNSSFVIHYQSWNPPFHRFLISFNVGVASYIFVSINVVDVKILCCSCNGLCNSLTRNGIYYGIQHECVITIGSGCLLSKDLLIHTIMRINQHILAMLIVRTYIRIWLQTNQKGVELFLYGRIY